MTDRRHTDLALCRRILLQTRPYWPHLAGTFLLGLLATPLTLLAPLPLKVVLDAVTGGPALPRFLAALLPAAVARNGTAILIFATVLFVAIAVVGRLHEMACSLLRTYLGEKLLLGFRTQLFLHSQRLSLSYHDPKGTADSTYRIQYDAPAIKDFVLGVMPFFTTMITLATMIIVASRIDAELVLVALLVTPILLLATAVFRRRIRRQWSEVKELESSALSVVQEVLGSVRVVKAFGQEGREHARFHRQSSAGLRARLRIMMSEGVFGLIVTLIMRSGMALVLFLGARHVQGGALSAGDLVLLMSYLMQIYNPLTTLSTTVTGLQSSLAGAERAFSLLDEAPDVVERPNARPLARARGAVAFRDVSFAYQGGPMVLHDISFEVPAGSRVGLVGQTGAGKTTLMALLTRFYDPTAGAILLDGVDLRDYKLADLRNQFGIVLQEPVLFSCSIAENIAYARPGAGFDEIAAAAQAAGAHDFIRRLPQGYDTPVGERGMTLSGGERQRVSLARAFLKDAPLLILDEPTSAVDLRTEAAILEAMRHLMRGRTTFLISHRQDALEGCDLILELAHGRLVGMTPRPARSPAGGPEEVGVPPVDGPPRSAGGAEGPVPVVAAGPGAIPRSGERGSR